MTFTNTLKYVFMATSANFGNMFSMAGASIFLPFLPLLPSQILLTNMLTDTYPAVHADFAADPPGDRENCRCQHSGYGDGEANLLQKGAEYVKLADFGYKSC